MNTPAADHSPERIQKLLGFLAVDPGNLTLRITIADLQHASGDFAAAEESFRAVLEVQPDHAIARSRMASVYLSQHRFDEAEAVLRGLDAQVQQVPAISHNMGLALVYQQK
jgi:thioredoxin-like negative regulator of GroEL